MWKRLFPDKAGEVSGQTPAKAANGHSSHGSVYHYKHVLAPAIGRHFSKRSVEVACRLAKSSGAPLTLAYLIEVPRSLVLEAALPEEEALALEVLTTAAADAKPYKVAIDTVVHRVRNARDGLLMYVSDEKVDLLVLGTRPDETRGLPIDLTADIFSHARCEVILDHIAGEK